MKYLSLHRSVITSWCVYLCGSGFPEDTRSWFYLFTDRLMMCKSKYAFLVNIIVHYENTVFGIDDVNISTSLMALCPRNNLDSRGSILISS